ncbi:uncharacterized protein LOC123871785 isoform X3 [Maniola jurtina]|uniref:uncharacterized protein LOC123871785 isoform X3 n=1 Tax=Maniola jurtina TaxID=191418 RepID=UPI001E68BCF5|nr:uncharacterized protein LOC123871785 isoform X3 [Maniola jurtina]
MRKKLLPPERPICNVVAVYRERGNYLQRLEQFEKAILAYNEALRWNNSDVGSLLGRSLARAKSTYYTDALADAAKAAELEPENLTAMQIRAQTEYEKCSFERALVLAYRGQRHRGLPPNFADCARCAEETIRECVGKSAGKVLSSVINTFPRIRLREDSTDVSRVPKRKIRMQVQSTQQIQEISRVEKQKAEHTSRLMASKYLEQMAHDKYFLRALCKDERLSSANKQGSQELQELAHKALADIEKRQKRVREEMSEADREKRAFILLGIPISREPSHDSILRTRPPAPPRDAKRRLRTLERSLTVSGRAPERCYVLHELARLHADTKQAHRARFYAVKCQSEAKSANLQVWLLNASFLLARCHVLQNNRPEARAQLIEGAALARSFHYPDVAAFFDTCVDISLEGEIGPRDSLLVKREKAMVSLMQDDDLRQAAVHLFRRMSVLPASRRFSIMPGARTEDTAEASSNRRASIMPRVQTPVRVAHKKHHPLGFQDFDI